MKVCRNAPSVVRRSLSVAWNKFAAVNLFVLSDGNMMERVVFNVDCSKRQKTMSHGLLHWCDESLTSRPFDCVSLRSSRINRITVID